MVSKRARLREQFSFRRLSRRQRAAAPASAHGEASIGRRSLTASEAIQRFLSMANIGFLQFADVAAARRRAVDETVGHRPGRRPARSTCLWLPSTKAEPPRR